MAINKNHPFEDIDGIKCAVVETGVSENRMQFLKSLLELNRFTVVVSVEAEKKVPAPPPAPVAPPTEVSATENTSPPPAPITPPAPEPPADPKYKVGVTDVTFNSINAIYGRLLKTANGRVVTMAYWLQKEDVSHDEIPYFDKK